MNEQEKQPFFKVLLNKASEQLRRAANSSLRVGASFSYAMGVQTQQWLRFFGQCALRPLKAAGRVCYKAADVLVLRRLRAVRYEAQRVSEGFSLASERMQKARERGRVIAVLQMLALPFMALKRHRRALACIGNILMPIAAALVLVFTVQYWSNLSFGLALEYEGERFGYISDESVFDNAAVMATSRVCETNDNTTLEVRVPKMTLAVVSKSEVLDEATVCDKIIQNSGDEFAEATGLYLNGELVGAMTSADELEELLSAHLNEQGGENRKVEFVQAVTTQNGLYPIATIVMPDGMQELLNEETQAAQFYTVQEGDTLGAIATANGISLRDLLTLNRLEEDDDIHVGETLQIRSGVRRLQVRVTAMSSYDEVIEHTVCTEYDDTAYEGTRKVRVKGKDGVRRVTLETVTVDGRVVSTTVVSSVTTSEPVEEVVVIGTKKRAPQSSYTPGVPVVDGDGVVTGNMVWPVPSVHSMSQRFHGGHGGIDIANGPVSMMNQPVVAADGGTVKEANTNPNVGYGIYVVVDHGNGVTTMYAHLQSLSVTVGQPVSRGQQIGRAGSTGWSSGPHLHFEVRVNGRCVNPLNYVS